jgi:hypothetical protein
MLDQQWQFHMGTFLDQVRNGKIAHPTQMGFDVNVWQQNYGAISEHDTVDTHLLDAGLFFNEIFCRLRDKLAECSFHCAGRRERLTALCALINHELAVLATKTKEHDIPAGSTVPLPSIIEKTVTLRSGIKVTPDQLITTLVDSAVYPLDEALRASDEGESLATDLLGEVGLAFTVANLYRVTSDYWHECLWGGKFIERHTSGRILIRPEDSELARKEAVSDQRHYAQLFTGAQHAARMWRNRLSIMIKKAMVIEKGIVDFDPGRRKKFKVAKLKWHRRQNAPSNIISWIVAYEDYLQPFMRLPLPKTNGLTIETLRHVWDVLGTLIDAALRRIPDKQPDLDRFLAHAIVVSRAEIEDVLVRALPLDGKVITSAIDFLTYRTRSDGLWQKPLIPLSGTEFLVVSAPLKYGNMLRTAERWLRQGGFDLDRRGPVFEKLARETIAKYLKDSPLLHDYYVAPDTVFVGPEREEIDLLIRIGRLLLVGEAKCQIFPAEALETYRFRQRLSEGAVQATRKVIGIQNSLGELQSAVGLSSIEDVTVVPLVLSNHILGSGYPIDGVPVVDLVYLGTLLKDGYFRTMVVMGRKGEEYPGNLVRFYTDQADAERCIPKLLSEQPVMRVLGPLVKRRIRPVPLDAGGTEIFEEYFSVSLEDNLLDFEALS